VSQSNVEFEFEQLLKANGIPLGVAEYHFHPTRRWRFDRAWPKQRVAVELEGGIWGRGRHVRPQGFSGDIIKYNEAAKLGWLVLRFTSDMVRNGMAVETVKVVLAGR